MAEKKHSYIAYFEKLLWLFFIPPAPDPAGRNIFQRIGDLFPHINFKRPVPMDLLRITLQILFLILIKPQPTPRETDRSIRERSTALGKRVSRSGSRLSDMSKSVTRFLGRPVDYLQKLAGLAIWDHPIVYMICLALCLLVIFLSILTPFDLYVQAAFVCLMWVIAILIRNIPGRLVSIILVAFSFTASSRYLWWRCNSTLNWNDSVDLFFGLILLFAEIYVWLVLLLGYLQTTWPLKREPAELPGDVDSWPTVDIFIPTYNEPLKVVRPTVLAAQFLDWPKDKLNIYILDDGCRPEFKEFAQEVGVHYFERQESTHAKAGNINLALTKTRGEFVAIFDCDHIPVRSFLQSSMGLFVKDRKLAVVQTPHHFYSADPFERNLNTFGKIPNENELFYALIQDGNDLWDATFFCGSCAVIRREPLQEIGGVAVETVTEDAHTALRLHRQGYRSAFLTAKQAAGLATESLSAHIAQRIRWARGMTQIFRLDNPLLGKGLSLPQRLCYLNSMLHFFNGIPRLIFLTSPLAFLLLKAYIIYAPGVAILLYVLPHLFLSVLTNSRLQGRYRFTFWSEIYETALAWHIARPTTVALFAPHKGKFNVTEKGGLVKEGYFDWTVSKSYLTLVTLNFAGLLFGIHHILWGDPLELQTVLITMAWTVYNIAILGTVVAATAESKQVRQTHRIKCDFPIVVYLPSGHSLPGRAIDFSEGGIRFELPDSGQMREAENFRIGIKQSNREFIFPVHATHIRGNKVGGKFQDLSLQQEKNLIWCTFARADIWLDRDDGERIDRPVANMMQIIWIGAQGYGTIFKHLFKKAVVVRRFAQYILDYLLWLLPRNPRTVK